MAQRIHAARAKASRYNNRVIKRNATSRKFKWKSSRRNPNGLLDDGKVQFFEVAWSSLAKTWQSSASSCQRACV
jgi:hypothetical protein